MRSLWKIPFVYPAWRIWNKRAFRRIFVFFRFCRISKLFAGRTIALHRGRAFYTFNVKHSMVNHRFYEFVFTKRVGDIHAAFVAKKKRQLRLAMQRTKKKPAGKKKLF
jgi:ribosomal protein S19